MTDWLGGEDDELAVDQRWPPGADTPAAPRAMAVVGAAVVRRLRAARLLPPRRPLAVVGGPGAGRGARRLGSVGQRYDSGEWDDPPGKLALLYDLERLAALLREGGDPFDPDRDRRAFARFLIDGGCQPPPSGADARPASPTLNHRTGEP